MSQRESVALGRVTSACDSGDCSIHQHLRRNNLFTGAHKASCSAADQVVKYLGRCHPSVQEWASEVSAHRAAIKDVLCTEIKKTAVKVLRANLLFSLNIGNSLKFVEKIRFVLLSSLNLILKLN